MPEKDPDEPEDEIPYARLLKCVWRRFGFPGLLAAIILIVVFKGPSFWEAAQENPILGPLISRAECRLVGRMKSDQLMIGITHLENDPLREHEKTIRDGLVNDFKEIDARGVDCTIVELGADGSDKASLSEATSEAESIVERIRVDALIWGAVISSSGKLRLHWTAKAATNPIPFGAPLVEVDTQASGQSYFKLSGYYVETPESLELPLLFQDHLKLVVALLAASRIGQTANPAPASKLVEDINLRKSDVQSILDSPDSHLNQDELASIWLASGNALAHVGVRTGDLNVIRESEDAYDHAISLWSDEKSLSDRTTAQIGLASLLAYAGRGVKSGAVLDHAISIFTEAEKAVKEDDSPNRFILFQNNFGETLTDAGYRENDVGKAESAVERLRKALKVAKQEWPSSDWARVEINLGNASANLGRYWPANHSLDPAIDAYSEALDQLPKDTQPLIWAQTKFLLGDARKDVGAGKRNVDSLRAAEADFSEALKIYYSKVSPNVWVDAESDLGDTQRLLACYENDVSKFESAEAAFRRALTGIDKSTEPQPWAAREGVLGGTLMSIAKRTFDLKKLHEAQKTLQEALTMLLPFDNLDAQYSRGYILRALSDSVEVEAQLKAFAVSPPISPSSPINPSAGFETLFCG